MLLINFTIHVLVKRYFQTVQKAQEQCDQKKQSKCPYKHENVKVHQVAHGTAAS